MSTIVQMGEHVTDIGCDWSYGAEIARDDFEEELSEVIVAWLEERDIPIEIRLDGKTAEVDGDSLNLTFDVGLAFENPSDALLFKLTFGGS